MGCDRPIGAVRSHPHASDRGRRRSGSGGAAWPGPRAPEGLSPASRPRPRSGETTAGHAARIEVLHQLHAGHIDRCRCIRQHIDRHRCDGQSRWRGDRGWIRTAARPAAARHLRVAGRGAGGPASRHPRVASPARWRASSGPTASEGSPAPSSPPRSRVGSVGRPFACWRMAWSIGPCSCSGEIPGSRGRGSKTPSSRGSTKPGRRAPGRRGAHARHRVPDDRRGRRRGRGHLGVSQSSRVQRHQVLRLERHEAPGCGRGPDRGRRCRTPRLRSPRRGRSPSLAGGRERYLTHLEAAAGARLDGMTIVVDCANGAASGLAPTLYERLGATVHPIHDAPDGRNINVGCGALHPEVAGAAVVELGADAGVSHDGDADRALFVDATGTPIDGDQVLAACAIAMKEAGAASERRGGHDRDGQPRLPSGDARRRASRSLPPRWATGTSSRRCSRRA